MMRVEKVVEVVVVEEEEQEEEEIKVAKVMRPK